MQSANRLRMRPRMHFFVPRLVELSMVFQDNLGILYVRLVRLGQSVLRPVLVVTLRGVLASLGPRDSLRASVEHISALPGCDLSKVFQNHLIILYVRLVHLGRSSFAQHSSSPNLCRTHLCTARLKKFTSTRVSIRSVFQTSCSP